MTASMARQIAIMKDFKTTALVSTPSHALSIIAGLEELDVHPERLNLRLALFGGERWSDELQHRIEEKLHIMAIDTYGLTAIMGTGVAGECHFRCGLHINEDHFIVEVIDPTSLEPVEPGREGELVLRTITKEGFPLIRYRTGDITSVNTEPCACGRTLVRMARVSRRTDDLIFFHGVGFFPVQIEKILFEVEGLSPHYQIILDRQGEVDTLEIKVEVLEDIPALDEIKTLEILRNQVARRIKAVLNLDAKVTFAEPKSLRSDSGPIPRVLDRRPG